MSNRETYSEIRETLAALGAPPGDTITERIRGIIGPAAAALHEAGVLAGDGTLAEAIGELARRERRGAEQIKAAHAALLTAGVEVQAGTVADGIAVLAKARDGAIAAEQQRLAEAHRGFTELGERARLATERADRMDTQWAAAERRAANLEGEVHDLRAETQRLQAQLDYATELHLSAMRARA